MTQKLKLHSPVGSDPLILKWPIPTSEGKDGPEEILDTIRLVCDDYPELKAPLETRIIKDGDDVSNYDFEQTKAMCERYNKAIDSLRQLVKGHTRQKCVSKQASMKQLKHILQQCYNHSVKDPEKLNHYEPFSPEVYGETSFELVEQMIKYVRFSDTDYFIDLGSGVGQVVLQVSAATNCKFCYGVEKAEWPAEYAQGMEKEFRKWMKWYGKDHGDFKIEKGDFLHDDIKEKLNKATIVFVNNFAFGPVVDHELKQRFANCLKEGARIVSSKAFCPLNFRITARNLSDIGTIMQVEELSPLCGAVSWTGKPFAYYVHTIDRTLLEKYFQRLKYPSQKNEDEPRKDRKGRPLLSIKDKINGALSGGSDSNSSGRWHRLRGVQRDTETASPLCAAKILDFDSGSNSSFTNSGSVAPVDESCIVYGPTTRRQWNEYVKRPQSQSGTENDNDSSAADANSVDLKPKDQVKDVTKKKKKMKSVKRLNNGALGLRKMQVGRKSEPVKSKAAVKLRPRKKQVARSLSSKRAATAAAAAAAAMTAASTASGITTTTTSTISSNPAAHTNGTATPSLDSLNLLHAHTIMSTSGKDPAEKVNYNDRRMTETSSAYFKPTVQKQTVSMLEKEAGFLQMIETMKQRFLSFLTFMQTPEYRAMLLLQIEQEKRKNTSLKSQTDSLEKDISVLQKDGVRLIKDRLKEMGIRADTPRELISQAKDIVLRHHELKSQTASLGAQITALQTEHNHKVIAYRKALDRKLTMRQSENGFGEHISHMDKERLDQQFLLASINRLYTDLQLLQNVNKPYVVRPEAGNTTHSSVDMGLNVAHESRGAGKVAGILDHPCLSPYMVKEKLDMKENYDAFGTVLAMVKKELTSTLQSSTNCQGSGQPIKLEPGQLVDAQNESVKQDAVDKTQPVNVDLKLNCPAYVKDAIAANAQNNMQSFQTSETLEKDVSEMSTSVSQISSSTSSWTSEMRTEGVATNASPRILPPGMKIDIKKPSRLNGLSSALKARVSNASSYTVLQNPDSVVSQSYQISVNTSFSTGPTFSLYTENEKSAAEDLISLKESLNTSSSSIETQGPVLNKIPMSLPSSSLLSSLSGVEYVQSHTTSSDLKTSSRRHSPHDKQLALLVNKAHTGSSNSLSKDSSLPCAISPSSTPHVFAQVPVANITHIGSSCQLASQNNQILSTTTPNIAQNNVKIITNLSTKNVLVKHKNYDTSIIHRPVKVRTLEAGSDAKLGMTSILSSALRPQPQQPAQVAQAAAAAAPPGHAVGTNNRSQVLKAEHGHLNQSFLSAHMGQAGVSSANSRSMAPASLPFVTVQSPHAIPISQGSNGVESSVLKILHQKPIVISPNNNSVYNGTVCNINSHSGSLAISTAVTSHGSSVQSDTIGQAVKFLPPNGRDTKGGLRSPDVCSLVVSEFEPVSPAEHEHSFSTDTLPVCGPHATSADCGLDSVHESSDMDCSPDGICMGRKRRKCRCPLKLSNNLREIPSKVSKLSAGIQLDCADMKCQNASSLRAAKVSRLDRATDTDGSLGSSFCEINGSNVSVILKREAKLERMIENISGSDHRGEGAAGADLESHVYEGQPSTASQNNKNKLKAEDSGQSEGVELMTAADIETGLVTTRNPIFDTDVTSSQQTFSCVDHSQDSRKSSQTSVPPSTSDSRSGPHMTNNLLVIDRAVNSRLVQHRSVSHTSRRDNCTSGCYQRHCKCSSHRSNSETVSEAACMQSGSCSTAARSSHQATQHSPRAWLLSHGKSSSDSNDQSDNSEQPENTMTKSDCKCNVSKSETANISSQKDITLLDCNLDVNLDCVSDRLNMKHEKRPFSRHTRSSVSDPCRKSSLSSTPVSNNSSIQSKPKSQGHYSSDSHHSSHSPRSCLLDPIQEHKREASYKGTAKSISEDGLGKDSAAAAVSVSKLHYEVKHHTSAKCCRRHSSCRHKDTSPGPPKLERAVTPPLSHHKWHDTVSQRASQAGHRPLAGGDTRSMDVWNELCDGLEDSCVNHQRESTLAASTNSNSKSSTVSEYRVKRSSVSNRSDSRHSSQLERHSSSPTLKRHSRSGHKLLVREEVMKDKNSKFLGTRSQRSHKSRTETVKSELKVKCHSKLGSWSTANDSSMSICSPKPLKSTGKCGDGSEAKSVTSRRRRMSRCSVSHGKSEVNQCKLMEDHSTHVASRESDQVVSSGNISTEKLPDAVVHEVQPERESPVSANLDSPYSLLTPKSVSHSCQMDDDNNVDYAVTDVFEQNKSKYTLAHKAMINLATLDVHFKDHLGPDHEVVNNPVPDAESFPFPPTPGKTPRSASVPCSPCTEITNQTPIEEVTEVTCEEVKADSCNNPVRKGPQTPPGSPLFNHQSQSRSRSLSVSSSSSRGSSRDSCQSTSSSSSFTDSSSDRKKRRRQQRRHQHLKTPPRKLSTLINQGLGISSPPKPTVLYSPMPSPNMNGFNYGGPVRLGLSSSAAPTFANHNALVGCSLLSPLSVSTQPSSGYQMVTSDSLRSPSGSLRSPVAGGPIRQHPAWPNTLPSPVSTVPPTTSASPNHMTLKDNSGPLSCMSVSSKELQGDNKSTTGAPDYKHNQSERILPDVRTVSPVANNQLSLRTAEAHPAAKSSCKDDTVSNTLDTVGIVKDYNGNNTTIRCSHSLHSQQTHTVIDYKKNVCQLPASLISAATHGSQQAEVVDLKYSDPTSDIAASLSCPDQFKSQFTAPVLGMDSVSGAYPNHVGGAGLVVDSLQSSCSRPCQSSCSVSPRTPTVSTESKSIAMTSVKNVDAKLLPVHGQKSNPYLPCSQKKELQYHSLPSSKEQSCSIGQGQQLCLLPQSKSQSAITQPLEQLHKLPPCHQTSSPPPAPLLPHQQVQHIQRENRQKSVVQSPHTGHYSPHLQHSYKTHSLGNRRAGCGFRMPSSNNPPHWGHVSSQVYPGPYCQNGSPVLSRPRQASPSLPLASSGFRDTGDTSLSEHTHNGIVDYPHHHGTLTPPYGSGQWDHSTPVYCMGPGSTGMVRSLHQHLNRSYHNKHH